MKSVLISIQPKWCELIASGKKTVEVRKTKPKLPTPFKCYIYESSVNHRVGNENFNVYLKGKGRKKVIGEFVCDKIIDIDYGIEDGVCFDGEFQEGFETNGNGNNPTCLSFVDLENYLTENEGYGWHISNLVIYENPKELSEFEKPRDYIHINYRKRNSYFKGITRPPQSWCYVEAMT